MKTSLLPIFIMTLTACSNASLALNENVSGSAQTNQIHGAGAWVTFLGDTTEYGELEGPEVELVADVARMRSGTQRDAAQTRWRHQLMFNNPWLPPAELRDCGDAFRKLCGHILEPRYQRHKVTVRAKVAHRRSGGKHPIVVPGSLRLMASEEEEQAMCWNLNMRLLPIKRAYFAIPVIAACEAVSEAAAGHTAAGYLNMSQDFQVLEAMRGTVKKGQVIQIHYSYPMRDKSFKIEKGSRVVWVCTSHDRGYGAVADTPRNRDEARQLAARMSETPVPTRRDLMDLGFHGAKVATHLQSEVDALFSEQPMGSGKWVLRETVRTEYTGVDGAVYFLPRDRTYYYRRDVYDSKGRKVSYYFGPYDRDRTLLPTAQGEQEKAW